MKRLSAITAGLLVIAVMAAGCAGRSGSGWVTLLDNHGTLKRADLLAPAIARLTLTPGSTPPVSSATVPVKR